MKINSYLIIFIFFLFSGKIFANENSFILKYNYFFDNSSWWLKNNVGGQEIDQSLVQLGLNFSKNNWKILLNLSSGYGKQNSNMFVKHIGLINNKINNHFLGESYVEYLYRDGNLKFGKIYSDTSKYLNQELSSGSMLVSKNASPIPRISLYKTFKIKKNKRLSLNSGISHGWFHDEGYYNKAPFLHEKFIYLTRHNENRTIGLGFVHEAMWGGYAPEEIKEYPSSFKDFLKVFISADGPYQPQFDHANALGNHLGIWDFYFINNSNKIKYKLYYQHFFEDTSSLRFANLYDGLWGIEVYDNVSFNLLIEYISSKNSNINPPYQDDYYYYNYQYKPGWRYQGNIIGNTFIVQKNFTEREINEAVVFGFIKNINDYIITLKSNKIINYKSQFNYNIKIEKIIGRLGIHLQIFNGDSKVDGSLGLKYTF